MDKNIEELLIRHIEEENEHQARLTEAIQANAQAIYALTVDIDAIKAEVKSVRSASEPIVEFFDQMESVGRVARTLRAIVGWLVLVVSAVVVTYVFVTDSIRGN
ncbi:MAG: hypothetical protein ACR2QW_09985 [bacterium]